MFNFPSGSFPALPPRGLWPGSPLIDLINAMPVPASTRKLLELSRKCADVYPLMRLERFASVLPPSLPPLPRGWR